MSKRLKFDDIDDWTPSSISIVDEPFHPLCKFEVYEDDEEYVKKSIEINEGETMVDQTTKIDETEMVSGPASFFEKLLGRNVAKSEELPPQEPPKKEEEEVTNADIMKAIKSIDERVTKLEEEKKATEPVKDAVQKSEGETEGEETTEETTPTEEQTVDEEEVITKSIDPDLVNPTSQSEQSFCKRMGRDDNGMTW